MKNPAAQAAVDYLALGWSVLPFRARSKRPAVAWTDYQHRRSTGVEIRRWFAQIPDANVGIVTGMISGLVVLDIDPNKGGDTSLAQLERAHGPLPHTVEAITGGGGRHVYFAHPGGLVRNKVGLLPGIDLRGDGGCVVAPPSLHQSGQHYLWLRGHEPGQCNLAPLPLWLLQELGHSPERMGHSLAYWRKLVVEGVAEGERNSTIASFAGHLLWHGVDPDVALELLWCWNRLRCRPPLSNEEVIRTLHSITRLHQLQDVAVADSLEHKDSTP
jgi:hypothetical protein